MKVNVDFLHCVCFIGYRMADSSHRMAGSAFMISEGPNKMFLVTAPHVIEGIRSLGYDKVWLRVNVRTKTTKWIETLIKDWFFHPSDSTVDVAILEMSFDPEWDHKMLGGWGISPEKLKQGDVGAGDEVFITGLFRHHHGSSRNIQIARHGNIACLNEETVTTSIGKMDAFLIEVRSIGGLSGSPVFVNLGPSKTPDGEDYDEVYLFGLIHGHFDQKEAEVDSIVEDLGAGSAAINVNTGIAIVVPYQKIEEVIKHAKSPS